MIDYIVTLFLLIVFIFNFYQVFMIGMEFNTFSPNRIFFTIIAFFIIWLLSPLKLFLIFLFLFLCGILTKQLL